MASVWTKRTQMNFSLRLNGLHSLQAAVIFDWRHLQLVRNHFEAQSTVEWTFVSLETRAASTFKREFECVTKWSQKLTNWFVSALEIPGICVLAACDRVTRALFNDSENRWEIQT